MYRTQPVLYWSKIVALAAAGPLVLACSNARQIKDLPPQTVTPVQTARPAPTEFDEPSQTGSGSEEDEFLGREDGSPNDAAEAAAPDEETEERVETFEPPPERAARRGEDSTMVVINPDEEKEEELSLFEASQRARQIRRETPPPVAVITDKNLSEFAAGGQVTLVEEPIAPAASAAELEGADAEERKWRSEARRIRSEWRQTVDEIEKLEAESNRLRNEFYAEDDPYVRDNQIKPAWDRVLDRLSELRTREIEIQDELDAFLEEGRRAGALPGWLREGIELEPERQPEEEPEEEHDPAEPSVLEERPPR